MNEKRIFYHLAIILLSVALLASVTIALVYRQTYTNVSNGLTTLCKTAMVDLEDSLRNDPVVSAEALYRYDEITSIYPDTYYKALAEALLPLAHQDITLTKEDCEILANCVRDAYGASPEFPEIMGAVNTIMVKYIYP